MRRSILSLVALVAVLSTTQPGFADPVAAAAADYVHAAALATEQPVRPTPASSASSDATVPPGAGRSEDIVPVGFGWG